MLALECYTNGCSYAAKCSIRAHVCNAGKIHYYLECLLCNFVSSLLQGVHHNEVAQLLEERILKNASKARKTRRRYAPSARAMLMAGKTLTEGARIKNENT